MEEHAHIQSGRMIYQLIREKSTAGDNDMPKFALIYYAEPNFNSPEEGKKFQDQWRAWIGGLGDAVIDPAIPLSPAKKVSSNSVTDSGTDNRVTGFSILKADSLDEAINMTKNCPHLSHGTVDVAEIMEMPS